MVSSALSGAARAFAVLAVLSPFVLPAQQAPEPASKEGVMLATPRYLFVLRGDVLYQFDVDTLKLKNRVRLEGEVTPSRTPHKVPIELEELEQPVLQDAEDHEDLKRLAHRAVERGLEWLARHQDADGKWDADGFMKHDDAMRGAPTDGPGNSVHDVGITGLALLAFLQGGSTMREGPYRDHIKKGVGWLRDQQGHNGLFGHNASHDFIYDHAIAAWAMAEAYGRSDYKLLRNSAQLGMAYLESHRNPYSVWRYQPRDNDNDSSVTGWCVRACVAGQEHGLEVNPNALKLAQTWFDSVTDATGRCGYTKLGEPSSRHPGDHVSRFPPQKGEALTATGLDCRFLLGQEPGNYPIMRNAADLILSKPPRWDRKAGTIDHYYWFAGSRALSRMGGRHWKEWKHRLAPVLAEAQRPDGNFAGSWDPVGVWGEDGGRVYSTALLVMALLPAADE